MSQPLKPKLAAIDGLRGIAVLLVVAGHLGHRDLRLIGPVDLMGIEKSGVFLFFVISAYLLTRQFLVNSTAMFTRDGLANYCVRRFFRIYPLFILVLFLSWIVTTFVTPHVGVMDGRGLPFTITGPEFWSHLFLQQGKSVLWSIVVEFKYYFVLPIIAFVYARLLSGRPIAALLFFVAQLLAWQFLIRPEDPLMNDLRLSQFLPVFLLGSFAAYVSIHWFKDARTRIGISVLGWGSVIGFILTIPSVYSLVTGKIVPYDVFHLDILLYAALSTVLLLASVHASGVLTWVLSLQPLRFLGIICFSFYLLHPTVLRIANTISPLPGSATAWTALAIAIFVSWVSFKLFETPFLRLTWSDVRGWIGLKEQSA